MAKPFEKGNTLGKNGRPKGSQNKATKDVRACIALIAERQIDKLESWIAEVEDPHKRADLLLRLFEYHIPKLARQELTGKDGADLSAFAVPMPLAIDEWRKRYEK